MACFTTIDCKVKRWCYRFAYIYIYILVQKKINGSQIKILCTFINYDKKEGDCTEQNKFTLKKLKLFPRKQ